MPWGSDCPVPPQKALSYIVKKVVPHYPSAHVVVTGDVTDTGTEGAFWNAGALLDPIGRRRLTVVPGNHDDGWHTAAWPGTAGMRPMLSAFGGSRPAFPRLKLIRHVALIGLDSTHRRLSATGSIGREQLARLKSMLGSPKLCGRRIVVALHHHPFKLDNGLGEFMMELVDAKELRSALARRVDVVLFGHKHKAHLRRDFAGVPLWLGAPSSVAFDRGRCRVGVVRIPVEGPVTRKWHVITKERVDQCFPTWR